MRRWVCVVGTFVIAAGAGAAFGAPIRLEQSKLTAPISGPDAQLGPPVFGASAALSADGNTALIGGYGDGHKSGAGAAWVFTRSGGVWTEQQKLIAPGSGLDAEIGRGGFGTSVALSVDGSTALIGAPFENKHVGAAWVFTRSGGVWTERGKLIAPASGPFSTLGDRKSQFGVSVALSSDGRTALIGGYVIHHNSGAAWLFTDKGGNWSVRQRLAAPRTGIGRAINGAFFGYSVALSSRADVALIGGYGDDRADGAAWVFTRSGGVLTQHQKLTAPASGAGRAIGSASFGFSVALSSDGSTALVGGPSDRPGGGNGFGVGAAWVFTRSGGVWTEPHKLVAALTHPGFAVFGYGVALSSSGTSALIGVPDEGNDGAAWAFDRRGHGWTAYLVPAPATGPDRASAGANFGISAALSGDGSTGLVGGYGDRGAGAAWVFGRPVVP